MLNVELSLSASKLSNTNWLFGPIHLPFRWKPFHFAPSGRVELYEHPNEATWSFEDGTLLIRREDGQVMWELKTLYVRDGGLNLVMTSPYDPHIEEFTIRECSAEGTPGYGGSSALTPSQFLFPTELQVTPTPVHKVLVLGSCLADRYVNQFRAQNPQIIFDFMTVNNAGVLPEEPPSPAHEYDFQYVQIPLRTVITDRVIETARLNAPDFVETILSDGYAIIDAMLETGLTYTKRYGVPAFVANFFVPQSNMAASLERRGTPHDLTTIVRRFNDYLAAAVARQDNAYLCDSEALAASFGKRLFLDDALSFSTHGSVMWQEQYDMYENARIEVVPHMSRFYETRPNDLYRAVFDQVLSSFRTLRQVDQVKAVIFDLDHTLWRGQIAEDYRADTEHKPPFAEWAIGLWDAVHQLRARGILVAICSKNELEVVRENWDNVVNPGFIKLEDFASVKINWQPKAENIREILAEFNIKAKSAVFVDDNPIEREAVRAALPDIRCIGANPYLTRRILLWSAETQIAHLTSESIGREQAIRGQIVREETRVSLGRAEFLASLNSRVSFTPVLSGQPEFIRVLELTNKTNQFNTSGRRWTAAELQEFIAEGGEVFGFRVSDRFAEYGLVGALYLSGCSIVQMVMSCRVLGMDIEVCAVAHAVERIRAHGDQADIFAEIRPTRDNLPCREVFSRAGFTELRRDGDVHEYELSFGQSIESPGHIEVTGMPALSLA